MASAASRDLTRGPVRGHLLRLTLPMIIGVLAVISNSVVDTFFVGQLGAQELSALAFTFPVAFTLSSLSIGLGAGAASVVSRVIGEGGGSLVSRRATDALLLGAGLLGVASLLGWLSIEPLFVLLGARGEVLELVVEYMSLWYWAAWVLSVPIIGTSLMRAAGDAVWPGGVMVLTAAVNAILDPLLIFGLAGFPRLEVTGAALASLCANAISAVVTLVVLYRRERLLALQWPRWPQFHESAKRILHIGVPAAAANMINPLGLGVVTAMLARYGSHAVAAFGAATRIEALLAVGVLALSASIGPVVGQNLGARQHQRVARALRRGFQFSLVYGLAVAALAAVAAPFLIPYFSDSDVVVDLAVLYLWLVPVTLAGYGINIVAAAALNAAARPLIAVSLTLFRMGLVYIPLAWVLGRMWGAPGIFVAAGLANVAAGVLSLWVARQQFQRK